MQQSPFSLQALIMKVCDSQRLENWYSVELPQIIEEALTVWQESSRTFLARVGGVLLMPAKQLDGT